MYTKTILITGAAGFLGSHLVDRFLEEGYHVIGIDNLSTGSLRNLEHLNGHLNFRFIHGDVSKPFTCKEKLDYILHFACPASPVDYNRMPIETLRSGSLAAFHLLELARIKNATILFASTSEIYGDPLVSPQSEQYWGHVNPIGPRSVYDESKRFQESLAMAFHHYYGVQTRIVRIFNTYGPRMRLNDGRVLPALATQALLGEDLQVFGNGTQTRCFCYITDMVEGIYSVLHSHHALPVNLGTTKEIAIIDFAKLILELTGSKSKIAFSPLPEDDPKKRHPDIHKAMDILNWAPRVSLINGLKLTLAYFQRALLSQHSIKHSTYSDNGDQQSREAALLIGNKFHNSIH